MQHYTTTGEGAPIVVLGETAGFGLLNDWFRLYAPEWPPADPADALTALITFIEQLDLWPVHLIARGDAAQTALRLATERPDLVRSLAVLGPLPACGGPDCRTRLAALATMTVPLLVLLGDDAVLDIAHSAALTRTVPDGRLAVLPASGHQSVAPRRPLTLHEDLAALVLLDFLAPEPANLARTG